MIYIIIGVSGSGKTAVGKKLAKHLKINFIDADDYHSENNLLKMKNRIPLTDKDRIPWLKKLSNILKDEESKSGIILACSALKQKYREILIDNIPEEKIKIVYLKGSFTTIMNRMKKRDHFFPIELLQSQFNDLEEPENALVINIENSIENIVKIILDAN